MSVSNPSPPETEEARRDRELAETRRALRRAQELLRQGCPIETVGRLAAGIGHELNTLSQFLADNLSFLGNAFGDLQQHLDRQANTPGVELAYLRSEIPEAIQSSQEGLRRVNQIVQAVCHLHQPGPGSKALVHLQDIVEDCLIIARCEWKYSSQVETEFDPQLPAIPCARVDLSLVVLHLLINAARAIREKGEVGLIQIRTRRLGANAELTVQDSGIGIPEKSQASVFDPSHSSQGLSAAYRVIVERHGGQLSFHSVPGKGTTFTILLPLA